MRKTWAVIALFAVVAPAIAACGKSSTDTSANKQDELVGTWLSTGTNIPLGLRMAPIKARNIVATFNANNTYTVVSTDSSNANTTMTGTWSAGSIANTGVMRAITVNQGTPAALTSSGIFQVTGTTLKYEVIQTSPAIQGVSAPTVSGGFGSSAYNGAPFPGQMYVQTYVKQ